VRNDNQQAPPRGTHKGAKISFVGFCCCCAALGIRLGVSHMLGCTIELHPHPKLMWLSHSRVCVWGAARCSSEALHPPLTQQQ
jgi:hypothetical protein